MTHSETSNDGPAAQLRPEQAQFLARMHRLMRLSALAMVLGIAVVAAVIGYRVFRGEGRPGMVETTIVLPQGARVISTAVAGDRIVVTVEIGGAVEIRTFDAHSLRPEGRLRFAVEP
jgi:hypothetical protein